MTLLLKRLKRWTWDSPTVTTWASLGSNILRFALPLPLILLYLPAPEVAFWFLLLTFAQLIFLVDFGFGVTTSRYIAYAMGGAEDVDKVGLGDSLSDVAPPNWMLIARLLRVIQRIYLVLGSIAMILIGTIGTILLMRPAAQLADPTVGWIAWSIVLAGSVLKFTGGVYSVSLQGTNNIPLLRRWEAVVNMAGAVTLLPIILLGGGLVGLAIGTQMWSIGFVAGTFYFSHKKFRRDLPAVAGSDSDRALAASVWSKAWRSGLGVLLNVGIVRLSGPLLAQVAAPTTVAAYLLAFTVLERIGQFSRAPFYSKIPAMARWYGQNRRDRVSAISRRGMKLSVGVFVLGAVLAGPLLGLFINYTQSDTPFIGLSFWAALAFPLLLHLIGAMHLQLYTLTNHIVWHIADGVSGAVYAMVALAMFDIIGVYAIPLGLLVGYGGFYTIYSVKKAKAAFPGTNLPLPVPLAPKKVDD